MNSLAPCSNAIPVRASIQRQLINCTDKQVAIMVSLQDQTIADLTAS
jgi:hypothetical protein